MTYQEALETKAIDINSTDDLTTAGKVAAYKALAYLDDAYQIFVRAIEAGADASEIAQAACMFADECEWMRECFVKLETEALGRGKHHV